MSFVSEKEAEDLAVKACEDYMTKCNCANMDDARFASQKLLAVANNLFETLNNGGSSVDTVQ